ncbi:hypothetical protein FRC17_002980 [Serendipita sp. 399]|nr:hypothetical protein FRC17_002980 [Serendipita sp. 399]
MMHLMIPHHLHVQTPPSEEEDPMDALDRVKEILADGDHPFPVDRKILKDVIRSKLGQDVKRVKFLSSGTFHKAFVVSFTSGEEVVMRIARRFMPRIKTESEVATLDYIRTKTNVPVPEVYHYESDPYNELEAEYIIMSKAKGVALQRVYREMDTEEKRKLFSNLAGHMLTLFKHRFSAIGSLYSSRSPAVPPSVPQTPAVSRPGTPRLRSRSNLGTRPPISRMSSVPSPMSSPTTPYELPITFIVGPMVSWPFFGEGRGLQDMDRGPWSSFEAYLVACCEREIEAVRREAEGRATAHRPHRPPEAEVSAPPSSDEDDEDDGEIHYRDYRTMQRSSLLVSYAIQRVQTNPTDVEVDMFREEVQKIGGDIARLWLRGESERIEWRRAHKVLEWDGWEEGLVLKELGLGNSVGPGSNNGLHVPLNLMKLL